MSRQDRIVMNTSTIRSARDGDQQRLANEATADALNLTNRRLEDLDTDINTLAVLRDGTLALTADWDAGSFKITAQQFESDVATGTAPLVVASTTKVANLNADLLDDQSGAHYLDSANFTGTNWTDLTDAGATTLHKHDHGGQDGLSDDDHTIYPLLLGRSGGQTLIGGTASGNNLVLTSTSNATKGQIQLDALLYVDTVDSRIGIGTSNPLFSLHANLAGTVTLGTQSSNNGAVQWRMVTNNVNRRFIAANSAGTIQCQLVFQNSNNFEVWGASNSIRPFRILGSSVDEALVIDASGNILVGGAASGTNITKGIIMGASAPPTSAPADVVQIWSTDLAGAGTMGLAVTTETGVTVAVGQGIAAEPQSVTLGVGVTTFTVLSDTMVITGDGGGNTLATIGGGIVGQLLRLIFVDALVAITDDNSHAADSVDLSAAFTSADDTTLLLGHDGTSWYEFSRSVN